MNVRFGNINHFLKEISTFVKIKKVITRKIVACAHYVILILLLFLSAERASAQQFVPFDLKPPQPVFRNYNLEHGLPSPETYDVRQDREGNIWIATDRGVVRYNGYEFRIFTERDGLPDHVIFNLEEDPQGRIWFVSYNGLLSYYEKGEIVRYKYNKLVKQFIGGHNPTYKSLKIDKKGNLYYAIQEIGALKITPQGVLTVYHPEAFEGVRLSKIDGDLFPSLNSSKTNWKKVWMRNKAIYMQGANGKFRYIGKSDFSTRMDLVSENGRNFLLLDGAIMDLRTGKYIFNNKDLVCVRIVKNKLFKGLYTGGVLVEDFSLPEYHPRREEHLLNGLTVTSVWQDREGGWWFTTLENGVYYAPDYDFRSYTVKEGLPEEKINGIVGNKNGLIAASYSGFIKLWPEYGFMRTRKHHRVRATLGMSERKLYLGLNGGGMPESKGDMIFIRMYNDIFSGKDYVVGGFSNIVRYNDDGSVEVLYGVWRGTLRKSYERKPVDFQTVVSLENGQVFAGNLHGLFEIKNRKAHRERFKDPIFYRRASDLSWHAKHGVIVATRGYGIYFFNTDYKVTRIINHTSGLLNDHVNCLYVDKEGRIYVGTNEGLSIVEFSDAGMTIRNVTVEHGLSSNRINEIYVADGMVWVATMKGITRFPLKAKETKAHGTVRLEYLATDEVHYEGKSHPYHFASNTPLIRLELSTDNFRGSAKHRFKYQLRKDGPWIPTDVHEIVINDPVYQEYVVRVKFMNEEGKWSAPVQIAHFEVELPLYLRWYVLLLEALVVLALIWWLIRVITNRLKTRHYYETKISQLEQKALSAQMNPHFIFNSLNSIQSFLIFGENDKAEHYLLKFSSLIRQTLNNSREKYIHIEQEVKILKDYLELEQMRFKNRFSFEIQSHLSSEALLCFIPPMLVQPYVENAILHGVSSLEKDGKIIIVFTMEEGMLKISIDDNGAGRQRRKSIQRNNHRSFGTTITEERLTLFHKQLGKSFHVETIDKEKNGEPAGTRVELSIPLMQSQEHETA